MSGPRLVATQPAADAATAYHVQARGATLGTLERLREPAETPYGRYGWRATYAAAGCWCGPVLKASRGSWPRSTARPAASRVFTVLIVAKKGMGKHAALEPFPFVAGNTRLFQQLAEEVGANVGLVRVGDL